MGFVCLDGEDRGEQEISTRETTGQAFVFKMATRPKSEDSWQAVGTQSLDFRGEPQVIKLQLESLGTHLVEQADVGSRSRELREALSLREFIYRKSQRPLSVTTVLGIALFSEKSNRIGLILLLLEEVGHLLHHLLEGPFKISSGYVVSCT